MSYWLVYNKGKWFWNITYGGDKIGERYSKRNYVEVALMDNHKVLVYGATGYTGKLICLRLKELNINFAIAGRNKAIRYFIVRSCFSNRLAIPVSYL